MLALLRPRSVFALALLLVASMLRTLHWMPFSPNHLLFEFYVDAGILCSLLYSLVSLYGFNPARWRNDGPAASGGVSFTRERIFEGFAPMARVSLVLLYFYAVFHKLNWDYFNPEISCGTFLTRGLLDQLHIAHFPYWGKLAAVWGTLVIELLIPVLFLFGATRRWGILLGLVFHFLLALHPHAGLYSFSALLAGFFYLFTPPGFNGSLAAWFGRWRGRLRLAPYRAGVFVLAAGILFWWLHQYRQGGFVRAAFVLWYVGWGFAFAIYLRLFIAHPRDGRSFGAVFSLRPLMWVFVLVVFFNGLSPYLGLKTQTSYSMFSNLRTEGAATNHVLLPRRLFAGHWQDDLVTVVRTNAPVLQEFTDGRRMIAHFELRRMASGMKEDFFVDYRRGGREHHLEVRQGVSNDPATTRPHPWLVKKLVRFRPVYADTCHCQH